MSTLPQPLRDNARNLVADVFWYGVLAGSSIAFLPVYAARIGAAAFLIGLLTSGPAVVNLLASLPAAHWLERRSVIRVTYLTAIWHRLGFLFLIPLPLLLPAEYQVWALPLITLAMAVPGTLLAIAFNALFADVIPPEHRGQVVGRRNALLSIFRSGRLDRTAGGAGGRGRPAFSGRDRARGVGMTSRITRIDECLE